MTSVTSTTPSPQTWSRPAQPGARPSPRVKTASQIVKHFLFSFLYLCSHSETGLNRCGGTGRTLHLHKWKSETTVKSSTKFRYISKVKAGSVFGTLFQPEGKALAKISQAWMAQMKEKKRRCDLQSFNKSDQSVGPISIEKYFDNLVSILYQSSSTISI